MRASNSLERRVEILERECDSLRKLVESYGQEVGKVVQSHFRERAVHEVLEKNILAMIALRRVDEEPTTQEKP